MTLRSDLNAEWPSARWFATDDATVAALWAYSHAECPNHPPGERCDLCGLYALRAALTAQRGALADEVEKVMGEDALEISDVRRSVVRMVLGILRES